MRTNRKSIILTAAVAVLMSTVLAATVAFADDGVGLRLAKYRSASVSDISYELCFNIPDSLQAPVTGTGTVSFVYTGNGDLMFDFTGHLLPLSQSGGKHRGANMCVNGKHFMTAAIEDEHIVIPREHLSKGRNTIDIAFESGNAALNRHQDYMYTLFVPANARSCFPCFDQPDLKATFSLKLNCPKGWESISSTGNKPISTYLFSFACGKFQRQTAEREGRLMTALYRETDSTKVSQLGKVFDEAAFSISWLEKYTGIKYPFDRYGFVILPGYQFGGMEHPGAMQFTDYEIFLGQNPTPDEELTRLELIAHETAHMWFGDLVTMRWFNDVWTKEVFANFLANKISREIYPDINHELNFLKSYQRPALSVDRTDGTHPIQQPLDNLKNAGLLYGNIIYDKAPVMMRKLEEQMGGEKLREGLRAYLHKYSFANATWDELVDILDSVAPQSRLRDFSDVWVKQKGLPTVTYSVDGNNLIIRQAAPFGRGTVWPQHFTIGMEYGDSIIRKAVNMNSVEVSIPLKNIPKHIYQNIDGQGYGRFVINGGDIDANIALLVGGQDGDETVAYSALLNLNENFLMGRLSGRKFFNALSSALAVCSNPLIGSTLVSSMATVRYYAPDSLRHVYERQSMAFAVNHKLRPVRQQLLQSLSTSATDTAVVAKLYNLWQHQKDTTILQKGVLTTRNYTRMAYHLAIIMSDKASSILSTQRDMLLSDDERREFDYVSRGCTADTAVQQQLFYGLIPKSGRVVEPWARQLLSLLCDRRREPLCNSYIKPGLDNLQDIQLTSDIFFPGYWLSALLTGQHSANARKIVKNWIAGHEDFPPSLMNKLKQSAYSLFCNPLL